MSAGLIIDPGGETVVVAITSASAGATISLYSDVNATSALANPLTITTVTKVFVRERTVQALVSLKVGGVEYGTAAGAALPYTFSDEGIGSCSPVVSSEIHQTTSGGTLVAWQPNTAYTQGQAVTYLGVIYLAKASFTSGSSFVAGNWDTVVPSSSGATVTELVASGLLINSNAIVAATDSFPFFIAPFACKITQVSLASKNGVAASDTNYWEVRLRKSNAGGPNTIASKYTKVTGGAALVANVDWNFDAISFDPTAQTFAKGDMFNVAFFLTGSSTGITWSYVACTIRYEPI